ncbi:RING finger protein 11 [Sesamum alatum]|uniref:RING-type E3 ubiquitin transferase n=1 Tax=Sesamum alatum TaxID=300844 RepID=A0AAE1Z3B3_9LAMI|nr:RING finger protein 11 [Sesamum alatum]
MAPPAWLPPLNSHPHYTLQVEASQTYFSIPRNFQRKPLGNSTVFFIRIQISVDFWKEDFLHRFPGLSLRETLPIKCNPSMDPEILAGSLRIWIQDLVPFSMSNCRGVQSPGGRGLSSDQLFDRISEFLLGLPSAPENAERRILPVLLKIEKSVVVPDEEFGSWVSWYEERKRIDPEFEKEYADAIARPRNEMELLDEATSLMACSSGASSSAVEELESVIHDGDKDVGSEKLSAKSCSICLEEILNGKRVCRLPCLHVYHGDCVVRWLRGSHVCPLCRYPLPTDD